MYCCLYEGKGKQSLHMIFQGIIGTGRRSNSMASNNLGG